MIKIDLPPIPVYDPLYGIEEKYRKEVEHIKSIKIEPYKLVIPKDHIEVKLNQQSIPMLSSKSNEEYDRYNTVLRKYKRKENTLNWLKKCRDFCKKGLSEWHINLITAIFSPIILLYLIIPLFVIIPLILWLFGANMNLSDSFLIILFLFPAGCVVVYTIAIALFYTFSQITIYFLNRKLSDSVLKDKFLSGDVPNKKVALEILREREDERFAKASEVFDAEIEKKEKEFPGIKAVGGDVSLYSRDVFKRESESFIKELKDIVNKCNQLYTKRWWMAMTPYDFEQEVANWFRQKGYTANTTQYSGDGRVDIVLEKDGIREFVQCKHYLNQSIPIATVRELFGVMASENVKSGYMVSLHGMTQGAFEFANKNNIKNITVSQLSENAKKKKYDDKVIRSGYRDVVLNRNGIGICVGDCFIYEDVYNDLRLAKETLGKRSNIENRWEFVISSNGKYYSNGYYAIVSCPISMKSDIQNVCKTTA